MSRIAVATSQPVWGCRWSQPGYRLAGVKEPFQPEPLWICTRDGARAPVTEGQCETCERWEPDPASTN